MNTDNKFLKETFNMIIQSLINPKIKHLVTLHTTSGRKKHQQFIAQGFKTCSSLVQAGFKLHSTYMTHPMYLQYQDQLETTESFVVTDEVMQKISTTTTPSGVVALFDIPASKPCTTSNAIALINIQDPGNLGTMIRTAAAMAIDTVFLIEGVDPYNPKVIQATTGAIGRVNLIETNWKNLLQLCKPSTTCALVVEGGQMPENLNLRDTILIIGNEGQGLPEEIINTCTQKLTIPMPGNTESLNAAVAGSIAMYLKSKI